MKLAKVNFSALWRCLFNKVQGSIYERLYFMIGKEKRIYNKQNKLSALVGNILCCDIDRRYYSPLYKRGGYWAAELAFEKTFGTVIRNRQKIADRRGFSLFLVSKEPNGSWNHMAVII